MRKAEQSRKIRTYLKNYYVTVAHTINDIAY